MRRSGVVASCLAVLWIAGPLLAHEGHAHKLMGTVRVADAKHIEVDTTDGKKVSIALTAETKYLKPASPPGGADTPAAASELKIGQRVVVSVVEESGQQTAKQILLGVAASASPHR